MLTKRLQTNWPYSSAEKKEIHAHYKAELERIRGLRKQGVMGVIEIVAYD